MSEYETEFGGQLETTESWAGQPIPIYNAVEETAPEYGSCMSYTLTQFGVGQPVQLLTRRIRREKAYVEINFNIPGTVTLNNNLAPLSIPQGYVVSVPVAGLYRLPDWETQQPLYCIASVAGLTASVIDMSYGERTK